MRANPPPTWTVTRSDGTLVGTALTLAEALDAVRLELTFHKGERFTFSFTRVAS